MTSGPSLTEFLTPYQLYADPAEWLLLCGRPERGFALRVPLWHVSDHLWEKHRVPATLRQRLTPYLQHLHPAVFRDPGPSFPAPTARPSTRISTSTPVTAAVSVDTVPSTGASHGPRGTRCTTTCCYKSGGSRRAAALAKG